MSIFQWPFQDSLLGGQVDIGVEGGGGELGVICMTRSLAAAFH